MKKLLIAFLLSLTCACTVAGAVACDSDDSASSSETSSSSTSSVLEGEATLSVDFTEGDGFTFVPDFEEGKKFKPGETASFKLDVSAFYTGYAVVSANGRAIAPNADGSYSLEMTESVEITVSGIQKEVSNMPGTGSFDDAFVVSRPVDLLYIAEQINAGVYAYVTGSYVLAADIDCGGEELQVIGDLSTENSYFSGCFSCMTDSETGEMERYTISNFVINSDNANYVGLFGAVYADLSVTSSGLFYGIRLDNFTINASLAEDAQVDNRSISAGGLIGYGIGANVYLCDATNGTINVYGDDSYFSFAGGLVGYQQAFYAPDLDSYFPSEIVYSTADVDVRIIRGMGLYAGGISGYLTTNYPYGATAFIHNSYASGNVSGALRSGGVVGGLGQYTSVSNSYAIGNVSARTTQSLDDPLVSDTQYCYSYAGGIVGYAENDTVVNDSFFDGITTASAASVGCNFTHSAIAGGDPKGTATASAARYVINNCLTSEEIDLTDDEFFTDNLSWGAYDWEFEEDEYPTIFYGSAEGTITATMELYYIVPGENGSTAVEVNGVTSDDARFFDTSMQSSNMYAPIGNYFVNQALAMHIVADNGYLAYGYFFDEACTQKVPYSYVPQKNVTLYVGFADPTPVVGTYQLVYENSTNALEITFDEEGIATYTDGTTEQQAYYFYDGETITVQAARLARYYDGEIVIDENDETAIQDAYFDMNRYSYYDFTGSVADGVLTLYDGIYFTADAPLTSKTELFRGEYYIGDTIYKFYGEKATVEQGTSYQEYYGYEVTATEIRLNDTTVIAKADLTAFDEFMGSWTKSATVNKTYTFDGMGGWTFGDESGAYQIDGGVLSFTQGGVNYTAQFNSDGFLVVSGNEKEQLYYAEGSYVGTWTANGVTVELLGINADGVGEAVATYADGTVYNLVYERTETEGYVALYFPHEAYVKDALFGYFAYNAANNTLLSTLTDPNSLTTGYAQMNLTVTDDYHGEWISNAEEFLNAEFRFDGNGLYGSEGTLIIIQDGVETEVSYTLDSNLTGRFAYDGIVYTMTYDEDLNAITLEANGQAELERKDALANVDFVDLNGVRYAFDGRSKLSTNGKLTVGDTAEYAYVANENGGWIVKDGENEVGSVMLTDNCYTLTINGVATKLYISNEFMGEWAIGGNFGLFEIGPTDLNGVVNATYRGYPVELDQIEPGLLRFRYREGNMPITYYVFVIPDEVLGYDVLVLSQYNNLYSGDYSICTKANELYGAWSRNDGEFTIRFDGVSSGSYSNGSATISWRNGASSTPYYYSIQDRGTMLWSQEALGGRTIYYKIEMLDVNSEAAKADDAYVQTDADGNVVAAFRRVEVDGLYLTEATDANDADTVYFFDGEGKLYVGNEVAYEYKITSYNTDDTAYLEVTKDGVTYFAVLDYSDASDITLKIEPLEEEAA